MHVSLATHMSEGNFHIAVDIGGFGTHPPTPFMGEIYYIPCMCHITLCWVRAPADHSPPFFQPDLRFRMERELLLTAQYPLRLRRDDIRWLFTNGRPHRIIAGIDSDSRLHAELRRLRNILRDEIHVFWNAAAQSEVFHISFDDVRD